jgi:hypothetical protein
VGEAAPRRPRVNPRQNPAGGTAAGDPRLAGHRAAALCQGGVRVPAERVLRPGHHAHRRSPTGPGREPRAEGATRVDPHALGRILRLDRAPEVKTIRRKITTLAATGRADELLAAMAATHVTRLDASDPDLLAVFYVDGHVRAYQGGAKIAKTHLIPVEIPRPSTPWKPGCPTRQGTRSWSSWPNPARPWRWSSAGCYPTYAGRRRHPPGPGRVRPRRLVTGPVRAHERPGF